MHTRTQTRTHRLIPTHAGKTGPNAGVWSVSWAHPHSRGENCKGIDRAGRDNGSSPLTRGKHYPHPKTRSDRRLIPTHAGKTCLPVRRRRGPEAHPHSRGENATACPISVENLGSSPLTRGKPVPGDGGEAGHGLIPTHAGKTGFFGLRWNNDRAHPHSRGENGRVGVLGFPLVGSSPLTRGKPSWLEMMPSTGGLIPTHAGKTALYRTASGTRPAHPHSRGENRPSRITRVRATGSSPLTRGKPPAGRLVIDGFRLIPTHAGKTSKRPPPSSSNGAHPHSRGENVFKSSADQMKAGSSPLTRGKRGTRRSARWGRGLIPTHAGKTSRPRCRWCWRGAHPHSRGENVMAFMFMRFVLGSSPLTRGKLAAAWLDDDGDGLIPTHAGKTV